MEAKTNEEFFNVSALIDERFGKEGTVIMLYFEPVLMVMSPVETRCFNAERT